jgi:8-oxo-dGTP diphosphatase
MAAGNERGEKVYYYIESDGKIYLLEEDGVLCFPEKGDELPFEVEEKKVMKFDGFTAVYCSPKLDRHPEEWRSKDALPKLDNLHHTVRESMHMSFPRCVAEAVILKDDQVLLVNASRGVTVGFWNLPGGFMEYGESPDECIVRELREEIGVDATVKRLLGVYDRQSAHHPYHLIAFVYLCEISSYDLEPDPDEIAEVGWFGIDEAIGKTKSYFTKVSLKDLKNQ